MRVHDLIHLLQQHDQDKLVLVNVYLQGDDGEVVEIRRNQDVAFPLGKFYGMEVVELQVSARKTPLEDKGWSG